MEYLAHGKFKYIDKYKSKAGKWVYKYKDAAGKKAKQAFNTVGLGGNTSGGVQIRPKKQGTRYAFKDRKVSPKVKRATTALEKLNDKYGPKIKTTTTSGPPDSKIVTNSTKNLFGGRTVKKETYHIKKNDAAKRLEKDLNDADKHFYERLKQKKNKAQRWLMDVNDKYGPKTVKTITDTPLSGKGQSWVRKETSNLFGGRTVNNEVYTVEKLRTANKIKPHKRSSSSGEKSKSKAKSSISNYLPKNVQTIYNSSEGTARTLVTYGSGKTSESAKRKMTEKEKRDAENARRQMEERARKRKKAN